MDELLLLVLQAQLPQHLQLALPAQGGVNTSTTSTETSTTNTSINRRTTRKASLHAKPAHAPGQEVDDVLLCILVVGLDDHRWLVAPFLENIG